MFMRSAREQFSSFCRRCRRAFDNCRTKPRTVAPTCMTFSAACCTSAPHPVLKRVGPVAMLFRLRGLPQLATCYTYFRQCQPSSGRGPGQDSISGGKQLRLGAARQSRTGGAWYRMEEVDAFLGGRVIDAGWCPSCGSRGTTQGLRYLRTRLTAGRGWRPGTER